MPKEWGTWVYGEVSKRLLLSESGGGDILGKHTDLSTTLYIYIYIYINLISTNFLTTQRFSRQTIKRSKHENLQVATLRKKRRRRLTNEGVSLQKKILCFTCTETERRRGERSKDTCCTHLGGLGALMTSPLLYHLPCPRI